MAGYRFPNESDDYRARRDELVEIEKDLRSRVEAVASKRRELLLAGGSRKTIASSTFATTVTCSRKSRRNP